MENKDSFFDFLDGTVGPVIVRPGEETRRKHLEAMEKEMIRLRRIRYRNRGLGVLGALLIASIFMVIFLKGGIETSTERHGVNSSELSQLNPVRGEKGVQPASLSTPENGMESNVRSNSDNHETGESGPDISDPSTTKLVVGESSGKIVRKMESTNISRTDIPSGRIDMIHPLQMKPSTHFILGSELGSSQIRPVPDVIVSGISDMEQEERKGVSRKKLRLPGFSFGLNYTPEYMFNTLDQTDKLVHNTGLEIAWRKGPFTLRTGLSLSVATGVTELAYHFNENLGVMQKLDSVVFVFDANGRKIVPSWFFSDQQVFDTAEDVSVSRIRKRYMYLQIPLILGYDFLEMERISFGLRAGPVLQILTSTRQLDNEPDYQNNRIIRINQLTPGRLTTHWQALFGLNVSVILSRRLSLEAEPHVKYYFNSVYEKAATTGKPWSIELRTALIYKF